MTEFAKDILEQKVVECSEALELLKKDRETGTIEAFRQDSRLYHSVCFRFITSIEALFEIGQVVLSQKGKRATGEESIGTLLAQSGIVSLDLAKRLASMYGFRNRLVHAYGTLDDERVAEYLAKHLGDIEEVLVALKAASG